MCRYISNGFLSYDDAKLAIIFHSTKKKVKKITKMFVFLPFAYFLSNKSRLFKQNDTHQRNTFLIPFFVISPPLTTLRKDHTPTVDHAGILFTRRRTATIHHLRCLQWEAVTHKWNKILLLSCLALKNTDFLLSSALSLEPTNKKSTAKLLIISQLSVALQSII